MEQGSTLLKEHGRLFSDYRLGTDIEAVERDLRHVKNDLKRVKQRELTMTIVAPTSAGKSTIINAIAEQDLLPRRDDPMTIVPTEIVFLQEASQAKFILDDTLLMPLREAWQKLHNLIQEIGMKETLDRATQASFLRREIVNEIANTAVAPFHSEVKESYSIPSTLEKVNDVFRLCNILDIPTDFLSSLPKLPRIEVPLPSKLSSNNIDRLVLIDTPGVTESKSVNLGNVVRDRLKASSLILLVLDCNAIGQEAPEKVKNMVDEIATIKGRDRIYIAINQIDRRNSKSLTTEEILDLAKTKYEIEDPGNRVFEISGLNAFIANNFWHELNTSPATPIERMKTVDALGSQYYGEHWSEFKAEATLEKMNNAADRLWQKSGFDRFINTAIAPLVGDAKPSSIGIKAALKDTGGRLSDFRSCLERQKGILDRHIKQIESWINQLEADLREVKLALEGDQWKQSLVSSSALSIRNFQMAINENFDEEINKFYTTFSDKLDTSWNRILQLNITKQSNHHYYLVVANHAYMNISMIREFIELMNNGHAKINEFVNRVVDTSNNSINKLINQVNSSLDYDNYLALKAQKRLQKNLSHALSLDKYSSDILEIHEGCKKFINTYKNGLCEYEEKIQKYESNATVLEKVKVCLVCDLPKFISTESISYDIRSIYNPYEYYSELKDKIEIGSIKQDPYTCSFYIDREAVCSPLGRFFYIALDQSLRNNIITTIKEQLNKDIEIIYLKHNKFLKEYQQHLESLIETARYEKNRYEMLKNNYIQILNKTANLETDLKYQQKYSNKY